MADLNGRLSQLTLYIDMLTPLMSQLDQTKPNQAVVYQLFHNLRQCHKGADNALSDLFNTHHEAKYAVELALEAACGGEVA